MRYLLGMLMLCCSATGAAAQTVTIAGPDGSEVILTPAQLGQLPRVSGAATFHGETVTFEGVDLRHVLRVAGVTPIDSLRGPLLRRVVIFAGADGYRVVMALGEIDMTLAGRQVVLVDRQNGAALPANRGPYRMIVASDGRPARSVWQLVRIEVVDLP